MNDDEDDEEEVRAEKTEKTTDEEDEDEVKAARTEKTTAAAEEEKEVDEVNLTNSANSEKRSEEGGG